MAPNDHTLREEIQRSEDRISERLGRVEAKLDRLVERVMSELNEASSRSKLNTKLILGLLGGGTAAAATAVKLLGG